MMTLFTAHTNEKSGKDKYGEPIEIRKSENAEVFIEKYSLSGAVAYGSLDGNRISREPATILNVNTKNSAAFFDAIIHISIKDIESLRSEAVKTLNGSYLGWLFSRSIDKIRYYNSGNKYDIKSSLLKGRIYSYVDGVGIIESDFIGNMFYGASMGNLQTLGGCLHDGDFLQDTGIDDVFDSHAIIVGYRYGRTGITINTFKSISNIVLDKSTISNGKFYHTYDIEDKGKSNEIKLNN